MLDELIKEEYQKYLDSIFDVHFTRKFIKRIINNDTKESLLENKKTYSRINKNGKWNFIDDKWNSISRQWYDYAFEFYEGYATVIKDNKYNFIDIKGNLVSKEWYDNAFAFNEGYAIVIKDNKYNFIDTKGNLLLEEWYDNAKNFYKGYAKVEKAGKFNFINKKGKLLLIKWEEGIDVSFNDEGYVDLTNQCPSIYINLLGEKTSDKPKTYFYNNDYKILQSKNKAYLLDVYNDIIMTAELDKKLEESDIPNLNWKFSDINYSKKLLSYNNGTYFIIDKPGDISYTKVDNSINLKGNIQKVLSLEEFKNKYLNGQFYENELEQMKKLNAKDKKQTLEKIRKELIKISEIQKEKRLKVNVPPQKAFKYLLKSLNNISNKI